MKKSIVQDPWNQSEASLFITDGCKEHFNSLSAYSVEKIHTILSNKVDEWHQPAMMIAEPQKMIEEEVPFS